MLLAAARLLTPTPTPTARQAEGALRLERAKAMLMEAAGAEGASEELVALAGSGDGAALDGARLGRGDASSSHAHALSAAHDASFHTPEYVYAYSSAQSSPPLLFGSK